MEGQQFTEGVRMKTFLGFQNVFEERDPRRSDRLDGAVLDDVLGSTEVDGVGTHPVYGGPITAVCTLIGLPTARSRRVDGQRTAGRFQIVGLPFDTDR
ncbi:MAG: hypothetical protein M8354_04525 [Halalkalicoccus sp.]|nr:hypothetical protein [Halalkalicoccus sp.]